MLTKKFTIVGFTRNQNSACLSCYKKHFSICFAFSLILLKYKFQGFFSLGKAKLGNRGSLTTQRVCKNKKGGVMDCCGGGVGPSPTRKDNNDGRVMIFLGVGFSQKFVVILIFFYEILLLGMLKQSFYFLIYKFEQL